MKHLEEIKEQIKKKQVKSLLDYNIFLVGFMGSGKTTIAEGLSSLLERERIEMDELIAQKQQMTIPEIFAEYGEAYFRNLESNTLIELQKKRQAIISCGGGVVVREGNADHMKKHGRIVLLTANSQTILERVKGNDERPILKNNMNTEFIDELMEKRRKNYLSAADIVIETDQKDVLEICQEIISKLIEFDKQN